MSGMGGIWGAVVNAVSSRAQRMSDKRESQRHRDWQTYMSNTAHVREASDLEAAGLNRILSLGQGASTPSGSTAAPDPGYGDQMQTAKAYKELALMDAQKKQLQADARDKNATGKLKENVNKFGDPLSDAAAAGADWVKQGGQAINRGIEWMSNSAKSFKHQKGQFQKKVVPAIRGMKEKPESYLQRWNNTKQRHNLIHDKE